MGVLWFAAVSAAEDLPRAPAFYKNGKAEAPTVQDLGGIGTRPLRILVEKNNKAFGDELIQVYAAGTHVGDEFRFEFGEPAPGIRVTVYKLFRETNGSRYFTMPMSFYSGEVKDAVYRDKVTPYRSQYLIIVFEKTGAPEVRSANQLYFEECERNLSVTSIRPNLKFCSLRFKMKDLASDDDFFTKDVQELIDRFIQPQRIFVYRLWKWDEDSQEDTGSSSRALSGMDSVSGKN